MHHQYDSEWAQFMAELRAESAIVVAVCINPVAVQIGARWVDTTRGRQWRIGAGWACGWATVIALPVGSCVPPCERDMTRTAFRKAKEREP